MFQSKEQDKTPEEKLNEVEINHLPDKEFKVLTIKLIKESGEEWMNTVRSLTKS